MKEKTRNLLNIIREMHQIQDYDVLLQKVLHTSRMLTHADAGTLYLRNGERLYFSYIENDTLFPDGRNEDKYAYTDQSIPVDKSSLAGFVAATGKPLLIADVYKLPGNLSYTFNPEFDKKTSYHTKSQLVIPLKSSTGSVSGVIQLINARRGAQVVPFSRSDKLNVSFMADHAALALNKAEMSREMVMRMVQISELRDPHENGSHAHRVGEYSMVLYDRFAKARGTSLAERIQKKEAFRAAAILHDIGKAGIPGEILERNGHYSQEEKLIMYRHTVYGARLFPSPVTLWDRIAREVILNHHERWDGSGYPGAIDVDAEPIRFRPGKRGREIPLSARIVAIADVYDALTSERPYKEAWQPEAALKYIKLQARKLFDPELVDIFLGMESTLTAIRKSIP